MTTSETSEEPRAETNRFRRFWDEWLKPILVVLIVVGSVRSAVADWNDVPTGSMKPTILEGDRIFVNKLAYDLKVPFTSVRVAEWGAPSRGDIVVFPSPVDGKRLVKRVVGVPGDTIELRNGAFFVNGKRADYARADENVGAGVDDRERYRFALETVEGKTHAVMADPSAIAMRSFDRLTVPEGRYFMMGDNRDASWDSRYWGFVDRSAIVGRATAVALSLDLGHHLRPRWNRFFTPLS